MPISFSAWRIISFVMRGAGVGDGDGDGVGDGAAAPEGVCANTSRGTREAATPAMPSAGSTFTKFRRSRLVTFFFAGRWVVFFFMSSLVHRNHRSRSDSLRAFFSVLQPDDLGLTKSINRHDKKIVVFAFRNDWKRFAAQLRSDRGNSVVMTGDEDRLSAQTGLYALNQLIRLTRIEHGRRHSGAIRQ